jgi:hypothetical protein
VRPEIEQASMKANISRPRHVSASAPMQTAPATTPVDANLRRKPK